MRKYKTEFQSQEETWWESNEEWIGGDLCIIARLVWGKWTQYSLEGVKNEDLKKILEAGSLET